jgi:hypothetical protein
MERKSPMTLVVLALLAPAFIATPAAADQAAPAMTQKTQRVVAGEQFRKGGLHRFLFGADYRDLWTMPVELPVLDLATFAGGLTPTRRLGHGQTKALALKGNDGVAYTFRPVLKDPIGLLPPELRATLAGSIVRDQMASQHPAGHVIVPPLAEAVGLLHNTPRLYVMPDDPALGEFREDFKGLAGDLEEFTGQQGFGGALEIIEGAEMWKRLDDGPETRVDSRAYLAARLLDQMIGDWDRHREQWRWAKLPGKDLWQPIPEDRDQAFVRFEGFAISFLRPGLPLLVDFGPAYPSLDGLTFDSWDVDRRLLADLERPAYAEVALRVKERLTDAVIESAVAQMPRDYFSKVGPEIVAALKRRRDALPQQADRFYRYLAHEVDVRGTNRAEAVSVQRFAGGDVEVAVAAAGEGGASSPYFRRRFHRNETHELRLHLLGGDDRVVTSGPRGGIKVRIVGGDGADVVDDSASGGTRVSDASGDNRVSEGPGTSVDRKPYKAPPPNARGDWIPPRDWGRRTIVPIVRITGSTDLGVMLNVGLTSTGYGFRKDPFADRQTARVGFATRHKAFRGEYEGEFHRENSKLFWHLNARASGIDILRFHGFGNETVADTPDAFFKVEQDQFSLAPSLVIPLASRVHFSFGPVVKYAVTEKKQGTLLGALRPYGSEDFGQLGAAVRLKLDTTDKPGLPSSGLLFSAAGAFYPKAMDVKDAFGEIHGEATTYLCARIPLEPTLRLHAGGKRVFGTYPFHEAAFLGGAASLRGLRAQRYAGDASVYGSAELRFSLAKAFVLVPGELGIFGLADVGRVYLEGEASDRWHHGVGGGVFFASPNRRNSVSLALARSEKRTGVYLRAGLAF